MPSKQPDSAATTPCYITSMVNSIKKSNHNSYEPLTPQKWNGGLIPNQPPSSSLARPDMVMQPLLTYSIMLADLAPIPATFNRMWENWVIVGKHGASEWLLPNGVKPEVTCYNSICLGSRLSARFILEGHDHAQANEPLLCTYSIFLSVGNLPGK